MLADLSQAAFMTLLLIGALLVLVGAGVLAAKWVRRRMAPEQRESVFTLQDLREMRAEGHLTEQEYESMRAMLIGELRREDDADADAALDALRRGREQR